MEQSCMSQGKCICMCLCVREFGKNRPRTFEFVSGVCLLLSLLLRPAVWPKPEILVGAFWITARDASTAGKPRAIWGSWFWFGIPPQTYCPSPGTDPGVGAACLYMCLIPPQSHSHTDLFPPPWKWPRPRRQTRLTRGGITQSSHMVISIVSHEIVQQPLLHAE